VQVFPVYCSRSFLYGRHAVEITPALSAMIAAPTSMRAIGVLSPHLSELGIALAEVIRCIRSVRAQARQHNDHAPLSQNTGYSAGLCVCAATANRFRPDLPWSGELLL